ncbi:hypothetical protein CRYUN_Cryun32bG0028500 [Craigia yunnanensis]
MNPRRNMCNNRVALFDGIEEGGIRASSLYSHDNEEAMQGLQDRVNVLKRKFVGTDEGILLEHAVHQLQGIVSTEEDDWNEGQ